MALGAKSVIGASAIGDGEHLFVGTQPTALRQVLKTSREPGRKEESLGVLTAWWLCDLELGSQARGHSGLGFTTMSTSEGDWKTNPTCWFRFGDSVQLALRSASVPYSLFLSPSSAVGLAST
ncbi:hypothetical protein P7K49_005934 [Saguinus oedipus]|uniref:Uncharacterized protein n=1 Tax=Saguinus oedipus TaxID=9490 RepID=A0ABQ9W0Z3_SAGOE|nr:hypothetical protein P7K49_005934 [Saguinus oedipus]